MNSFEEKVSVVEAYIDSIYRIENIISQGMSGMYGLEQDRIEKHERLCECMMLDREATKEVCLNLDKYIGFDLIELESDYDFYLEKYAQRLIQQLGKLVR